MSKEKIQLRAHHLPFLAAGAKDSILKGKASPLFDPTGEVCTFLTELDKKGDVEIEVIDGPDFICKGCSNYSPQANRCGGFYEHEIKRGIHKQYRDAEELRIEADKDARESYDLSQFKCVRDLMNWDVLTEMYQKLRENN